MTIRRIGAFVALEENTEAGGGMNTVWIAAIALAAAGSALAQGSYPTRPVAMVVGFAPGGGTDTVARIIAKNFSEGLG